MRNFCNQELCGREFEDHITVNGMLMYCPACRTQLRVGVGIGIALSLLISVAVLFVGVKLGY